MSWDGEHLFLVSYDIGQQRRWRKVYKLMQGYGQWLQLSVFQCRLSRKRLVEMSAGLRERINPAEDHVLIVDLGPAEKVEPKIISLGKPFDAVCHEAVII